MLKKNDFIKVCPNGTQRFVHENGSFFVPFGVNYFCKGTGWAPHIWYEHHTEEYDRDFSRMQKIGINVIRVFTSMATFLKDTYTVNEQTAEYIREMLEYAKKYDIRIIFSSMGSWDGSPLWINKLREGERSFFTGKGMLEQLAYAWRELAKICEPYESLFSYDICNEPDIGWNIPGMKKAWYYYCAQRAEETDNETLKKILKENMNDYPKNSFDVNADLIYEFQCFRNKVSENYVKICADAIRSGDKNHLVSIGLHERSISLDPSNPGGYAAFDPHVIGKHLDYMSVHYYPYDDRFDIAENSRAPEDRITGCENFLKCQNLMSARISYVDIGKPVVLEEFGLYGGGTAPNFTWRRPFKYLPQSASADWVSEVVSRNSCRCAGFLNWGFDDCEDQGDPTRYQGLYDDNGNLKELGKIYPQLIKDMKEYTTSNPAYRKITPIKINYKKSISDKKYIEEILCDITEKFDKKDAPYFIFEDMPCNI